VTTAANIDERTVEGFGEEWSAYDQTRLEGAEYQQLFGAYFHLFPWKLLPSDAEGFDLGCGSGRWAVGVAAGVGRLHCIDPSAKALSVARKRLMGANNVSFHQAASDTIPLADGSQDFGYSLGVLHHVPDTARALADCVRKLRPGAPFLLYLYYALENRPTWFRALWTVTDGCRQVIHRLPFGLRKAVTSVIAAGVYWPLARAARIASKAGLNVSAMPLSAYRETSFYTMRTDALDRFGTRLEQRFTREDIAAMMTAAGLRNLRFSEREPYWVAVGVRAGA
jgi:ubiquinone/menaquinone biosynthesis C-methylase UbiE